MNETVPRNITGERSENPIQLKIPTTPQAYTEIGHSPEVYDEF
jgi:hypothetical protein